MNAERTVQIEVAQLLSPEAAARQEAARAHAAAALRLVAELLELEEVRDSHRLQLEDACQDLAEAVDYLGPVEESIPPAEERS